MTRERQFATVEGQTDEVRLWRAVVARTIQEFLSGPLRSKREAEQYLFENSADLSWVCESAGLDLGQMRTRLGLQPFKEQIKACQRS